MALSPPRQHLLSSLNGQRLDIPDLRPLFNHWPQAENPHFEELRKRLPGVLAQLTTDPKYLAKLDRADFAGLASGWVPNADVEGAYVLMCVALWLFMWDDEIDQEVGGLWTDLEAAREYRRETIIYAKWCLGLSTEEVPVPNNKIIAFFRVIGDVLSEEYDVGHRQLLLKELEFFMDMSELEQESRMGPDLPTVEEYFSRRMGTSACNVTTCFNELAEGIHLPMDVLHDPDMRALWDETNLVIWLVNDLVSIKKEVQQQAVDSLVPLLYHKYGNLDMAVSLIVETVRHHVQVFDLVARVLLMKYSYDKKLVSAVASFINACRNNCTGNLSWSLRTGRYGIRSENDSGGITLSL